MSAENRHDSFVFFGHIALCFSSQFLLACSLQSYFFFCEVLLLDLPFRLARLDYGWQECKQCLIFFPFCKSNATYGITRFRCDGRVVKALDLTSIGVSQRRFEPTLLAAFSHWRNFFARMVLFSTFLLRLWTEIVNKIMRLVEVCVPSWQYTTYRTFYVHIHKLDQGRQRNINQKYSTFLTVLVWRT